MNFKAAIEERASSAIMSCEGWGGLFAAIDGDELSALEIEGRHEVDSFGEAGYSVEDGVATIKVRGMLVPELGYDLSAYGLTGYDIIEKYAANAEEDVFVKSILLDVDSGGGFVQGLEACVEALSELKKPINTFASGNMYSAAYWLGSVGKKITANASSGIGSIGVYVEHNDRSKALKDRGIESQIYKSGFWKGAFSSSRPLSAREKKRIQEDVDGSAQVFFEQVSNSRGISVDDIDALDGDKFTAQESLDQGLIDVVKDKKMKTTPKATTPQAADVQEPVTPVAEVADPAVALQEAREAGRQEAFAEAKAEAFALKERTKAIFAADNGDDAVKELLASEAFADVSTENIVALLEVIPKTVAVIMDDEGGAGVEADQVATTQPNETELNAQAQADASAKLAKMGKVI